MLMVDTFVVNVALPASRDRMAGIDTIQWWFPAALPVAVLPAAGGRMETSSAGVITCSASCCSYSPGHALSHRM
jgi:hypothetical protein